jgi:hypothetical protein
MFSRCDNGKDKQKIFPKFFFFRSQQKREYSLKKYVSKKY